MYWKAAILHAFFAVWETVINAPLWTLLAIAIIAILLAYHKYKEGEEHLKTGLYQLLRTVVITAIVFVIFLLIHLFFVTPAQMFALEREAKLDALKRFASEHKKVDELQGKKERQSKEFADNEKTAEKKRIDDLQGTNGTTKASLTYYGDRIQPRMASRLNIGNTTLFFENFPATNSTTNIHLLTTYFIGQKSKESPIVSQKK